MKLRAVALAGTCLAFWAGPVLAQDSTTEISDIIVTARRKLETLQDVPLVVNAVTGEKMEKLNIRDATDVQTVVPGLQLRTETNGIGSAGQVRGIQFDVNAAAPPSVEFYFNDSPIAAGAVIQTIYDINQVEVLRGPQGTLRGRASPSGSITFTSKKADLDEAGGYVQMTGNDIGTINANGAVGVPIIPGILAIRVAGVVDTNEVNRVQTIQRGGDSRDPYGITKSGRVSLRFEPADWIRLDGIYQRIDRHSRSFDQYESFNLVDASAPASNPVLTARDRSSIQAYPRIFDQIFDIYNWHAELRGLGQMLTYQGQHLEQDIRAKTNTDSANFLGARGIFQDTHLMSKSISHEVRLQNETRIFEKFDYIVGFFAQDSSLTNPITRQTYVDLPAFLGGPIVANTPISVRNSTQERSVFGNLTFYLGKSTELSGGLRYISYHQPPNELAIAGITTFAPRVDDKGVIYTASIKHYLTPDVMLYAMTGSSRRVGPTVTGDFNVQQSALEQSFLNLPTETSTSYEVGTKLSLLEKRLSLNLSAFHQTFKNYPFRNPTGVYYVNYAATQTASGTTITPGVSQFNFVAPVPVEVNGAEAELHFQVTPRWNVDLTASYALGKIKNGAVPCTDLNGDGIPDNRTTPPSLPELQSAVGANNLSTCRVTQRSSFQAPFSATLQTEYHAPLLPGADVFGRGLLVFTGSTQGDPGFVYDQVGAYGLLNLFAGLRDPHGAWELSFFAKNILDINKVLTRQNRAVTEYQRFTGRGVSAATFTSPYAIVTSTPPREFGLSLRYSFGHR